MVKNLPANAGDVALIPGLGGSPGEGNGNPLQYSCLGNPMDRRAWRATVHGAAKELDTTEQPHNNNSLTPGSITLCFFHHWSRFRSLAAPTPNPAVLRCHCSLEFHREFAKFLRPRQLPRPIQAPSLGVASTPRALVKLPRGVQCTARAENLPCSGSKADLLF